MHSIKSRDRINIKGYGFFTSAKNMGKNLNNKYSQKLLDSAKKSTTDAVKTVSKKSNSKNSRSNW